MLVGSQLDTGSDPTRSHSWPDQISVDRSIGYLTSKLVYGNECLLPIRLMIESWQTLNWEAIENREDLILARMQ